MFLIFKIRNNLIISLLIKMDFIGKDFNNGRNFLNLLYIILKLIMDFLIKMELDYIKYQMNLEQI